jgi:Arc/MetJ-type ribon-helix-helix transcriptional regulator
VARQFFPDGIANKLGAVRILPLTASSRRGSNVAGTQTESSFPLSFFPARFIRGVYIESINVSTKNLIFPGGKNVYRNCVPNQRAAGQKLLPIAVDEKFLRELDAGLARAGYRNRSQFVRDAIVEKLTRAGIALPKELALPPRRVGKGAKVPFPYPAHRTSTFALNEKATSKKRGGAK